jgi:hypothetical protein
MKASELFVKCLETGGGAGPPGERKPIVTMIQWRTDTEITPIPLSMSTHV